MEKNMFAVANQYETPTETLKPVELQKKETDNEKNECCENEDEKVEKIEHGIILFWGCVLANFFLAGQNVVMFFVTDSEWSLALIGSISVFNLIVFLLNICMVAPNKKAALHLVFLLDNIVLVQIAALIGFIGMMTIILTMDPFTITFLVIMGLVWFLYAGCFRVVLAFCRWKKWQIIAAKMSFVISSIIYLIIATYIMRFSFSLGNQQDQNAMKDFFFLYIFGLISLMVEVYSKISDLDGTSNLQYRYTFQQKNDEEKSLCKSATHNESKL